MVLVVIGGVALLTTDAVWFLAGASAGTGALGFRTRGFFAGGRMGVGVAAELHCIGSCD